MRTQSLFTIYEHGKPNISSVFLVDYKNAVCNNPGSFFWCSSVACSNLDWLDLEMETNQGEDQALQILRKRELRDNTHKIPHDEVFLTWTR